jgi:hypothetical protein
MLVACCTLYRQHAVLDLDSQVIFADPGTTSHHEKSILCFNKYLPMKRCNSLGSAYVPCWPAFALDERQRFSPPCFPPLNELCSGDGHVICLGLTFAALGSVTNSRPFSYSAVTPFSSIRSGNDRSSRRRSLDLAAGRSRVSDSKEKRHLRVEKMDLFCGWIY